MSVGEMSVGKMIVSEISYYQVLIWYYFPLTADMIFFRTLDPNLRRKQHETMKKEEREILRENTKK